MTVGELVSRLLWLDYRLPVVLRLREDAGPMPVEVEVVESLTYLPSDALVARGMACVIEAGWHD